VVCLVTLAESVENRVTPMNSSVTLTASWYQLESPQPMQKTHFHYNIIVRLEREGGFTAMVPALPGCVTYGRSLEQARTMAKDAITGYIESLRKHNERIPTDDETLVTSLDLEYAPTSGR
jgi:antitoxin HicB